MALHKGAIAKERQLNGPPRELTRDELGRLTEGREKLGQPKRLRESHHNIARMLSIGLSYREIRAHTGYTAQRIGDLANSPAMQELVALYRAKLDERFEKSADAYFELATANMVAAERHIADHIADLDDEGELLPIRTALSISRDAADRFGYGKHQTNTNVNVDFAAALEKAIARSGKTIEGSQPASSIPGGTASSLPPTESPRPALVESSTIVEGALSPRTPQTPSTAAQPPLRRRA